MLSSYISSEVDLPTSTMSAGEGRKISCQDIHVVQERIEQCLKLYMSQKEVVNTLFIQNNIEPCLTELIWQKLEQENQEFFKAYYLKLMVKEQIMEFNRLLGEQVELMRNIGLTGMVSLPMSNGSHISPMHQNSARCATENTSAMLKSDDMHKPTSTSLPNAFNNRGSAMNAFMQGALDMNTQSRKIDVSSNMSLAQSSSMAMATAVNGGIIKREPDYAASSSFNYAAQRNFLESRAAMADASLSSFSSVVSSSQPLNEPILDADTSSFGFLGQISQNFGLSDLTDDISTSPDILESYPRSPFLATDTNNFLDPHGGIDRFD